MRAPSQTQLLLALGVAACFLAASAPAAHAQGGLFISRLTIQPDADAYRLRFNVTERLAAGSFMRNTGNPLGTQTTPQTIITINRCGILNPHFHPRGTEQLYIVSGSAEVVMFLEGTTAPDTPIRRVTLTRNQAVILPAGSVHYTRNTGRTPLVMIQTFDNPLPGTVFLSTALFNFANNPRDASVFNTALPGLSLRGGQPLPKASLFTLSSC